MSVITTVTWVLVFKSQFYDLSEIVPGFLTGLLLTIIVSHATSGEKKGLPNTEFEEFL